MSENLTLVAAGVAFYAFLALIPPLIAFVSVYGLFSSPEDVKRQVEDISSLPQGGPELHHLHHQRLLINAGDIHGAIDHRDRILD